MNIKLPLSLALIALATLCSISALAQQQHQDKPTYRVAVIMEAKDEIKNEITSYINRELRSLGDIVIVDEDSDPEYKISLVVLSTRAGYAGSVNVTAPFTKSRANQQIPDECPNKETKAFLTSWMTRMENMLHHSLLTAPDLRTLCSDVVTSIDGDVFEKVRKQSQRAKDLFKRNQ